MDTLESRRHVLEQLQAFYRTDKLTHKITEYFDLTPFNIWGMEKGVPVKAFKCLVVPFFGEDGHYYRDDLVKASRRGELLNALQRSRFLFIARCMDDSRLILYSDCIKIVHHEIPTCRSIWGAASKPKIDNPFRDPVFNIPQPVSVLTPAKKSALKLNEFVAKKAQTYEIKAKNASVYTNAYGGGNYGTQAKYNSYSRSTTTDPYPIREEMLEKARRLLEEEIDRDQRVELVKEVPMYNAPAPGESEDVLQAHWITIPTGVGDNTTMTLPDAPAIGEFVHGTLERIDTSNGPPITRVSYRSDNTSMDEDESYLDDF